MEVFKNLIRDIVLIILLTTFLDMLLPSNKMRTYLKMVMGLFVLVSILNPLLNLLVRQQNMEVFAWKQDYASAFDDKSVRQTQDKLAQVTEQEILNAYAQRIEKEMSALIKLIDGVADTNVNVEIKGGEKAGGYEDIDSVCVTVFRHDNGQDGKKEVRIEQVKIGETAKTGSDPVNTGGIEKDDKEIMIDREVKSTLSQYFGISPKNITVEFQQ